MRLRHLSLGMGPDREVDYTRTSVRPAHAQEPTTARATVELLAKDELLHTIRATGFVEVQQPDVGADKTTAFILARRPDG